VAENVAPPDPAARELVQRLAKIALGLNGVLLLFVGLWLLVNSGRGSYFMTNAIQVDMVLLLFVTLCNLAHMALAVIQFRRKE
jgi:hypothetical protein